MPIFAVIRSDSQDLCKFSRFYAYVLILHTSRFIVIKLNSFVYYSYPANTAVKCGLAETWQAD